MENGVQTKTKNIYNNNDDDDDYTINDWVNIFKNFSSPHQFIFVYGLLFHYKTKNLFFSLFLYIPLIFSLFISLINIEIYSFFFHRKATAIIFSYNQFSNRKKNILPIFFWMKFWSLKNKKKKCKKKMNEDVWWQIEMDTVLLNNPAWSHFILVCCLFVCFFLSDPLIFINIIVFFLFFFYIQSYIYY